MRKNKIALTCVLALSTAFAVAKPVERIVALDFGALDTVTTLGDGQKIVAAPINNAPEYLNTFFKDNKVANAGGLKQPNLDVVKQVNPDFIVISGRANQYFDELNTIAPTMKYTVSGDDYFAGVQNNVLEIAGQLEKTQEAKVALEALEAKSKALQVANQKSNKKALVLLHNKDNLILSDKSGYAKVIFGLAGVKNAYVREDSERVVVDDAFLNKANPDVIYIVDRSAAIGDEPLKMARFQDKKLAKIKAIKNQKVVYLNPSLWYLSGNGLQSLNLQLDEVSQGMK